MSSSNFSRRSFLQGSASTIALASLPLKSFGATPPVSIRLEWQQYKTTTQYAKYLNVVAQMKAQTNAKLATSWQYWVNVHVNYCPHDLPYFFAWHRGYLYYLEQQMRTMLNDQTFTIPYWDYYKYPTMPSEFTDTASGNPLFVPGRLNNNVYAALTMAPFNPNIVNFQRGASNAFEPIFESAPHDPVHNIIGGYMADMVSPTDPIFYLHHANVDRMWHAWMSLPQTTMPPPTDTYWSGSFTYAKGLTMLKQKCYMPANLNYDYANIQLPTALPPQAELENDRGGIIRVQSQMAPIVKLPANGNFKTSAPRVISSNKHSLGGVSNVDLTDTSTSAVVPLTSASTTALRGAITAYKPLTSRTATPSALAVPEAATASTPFQSVQLVLDGLTATTLGAPGGCYYNLYLNLPAAGDIDADYQPYFIGTVGAFEAAGVMHSPDGTLSYPLSDLLRAQGITDLSQVVISAVRVNGQRKLPKGKYLNIREMRLQISTAAQ
jgi:tyrosinase